MKKKIGVIFGSRSCEREVAIISALQLMRHVNPEQYDVIPVYIDETGNWFTGDPLREIDTYRPFQPDRKGVVKVIPDLSSGSGALLAIQKGGGLFSREKVEIVDRVDVYIVVMHGLNGEDGTLQGLLELANIPYTSTGVAGSALGMDKIMMKQFFRGGELPVLPGFGVSRLSFQEDMEAIYSRVEAELGYPVFVKPANLGSSIGVSRADDRDSLRDSLQLAFEYDRRVLIEKGLNKPLELNCSVMGFDHRTEASPIEMPLNQDQFLDFKDKYLASGGSKGMASLHRVLPAPIEDDLKDEIQEMSRRIFRMLDCKGVVRIDYMYDRESGRLYITEINTIPGSLAFYLWENQDVRYSELIDRMIRIAEEAHEEKNRSNYAYTSDILKHASFGAKGTKGTKTGIGAKLSKS